MAPNTTEIEDHVYKILELVGSSEKSIEDAIQNALTRAARSVRLLVLLMYGSGTWFTEKSAVARFQ